jgi:ubiquinone/menaquinone biosynthesis C-methylase UbiE
MNQMNASSTFNASDGGSYEQVMGRWSRRLAEPFIDFAGSFSGEQILDVGCGTGSLASALARRFPAAKVRAVDFAPAYIDYARRTLPEPRITFEVGDACALRFPTHSFDRVLALLLLHFVPSPDWAIAEMLRVAKPGSTVAAAVWDVRGGFVANRMFYDTAAALDARASERRARNYTRPMTRPDELVNAWRAAGFADVVGTSLASRMDFTSFDDYWNPYEGTDGPGAEYLASLNAAERARLKEAVRLAYVDGEADGPRSFAALAWAVKGIVPG